MEKKPACYVYAPGQYVAHVRMIATSSLGVTIPKQVAKNLGLRPGMEVMIEVKRSIPDLEEKKEEGAA